MDGECRREHFAAFLLFLLLQEVLVQEGSITDREWTSDFTVEVEKKYVLAVGGRTTGGGGLFGLLNHYSMMQWEGLFPCLPELNAAADLEELDIATFEVNLYSR